MKAFCKSLAVLLALLPALARADAVLDWNETGMATVLATRQGAPDGARVMAMMHLAMFNAVATIEPRYTTYGFKAGAASGANASAAAAAAGRTVLAGLFPDQREAVEKAYSASLAKLSGQRGIEAGVALGEQAGKDCLAMRGKDGHGAPNVYRPITTAGVYIPTAVPVSYDWREIKPWVMKTPSQFRPEPPPGLTSATWTRDYNEIKEVGARNSAKRTAEQTEVARFWTATGAVTWNPVVRSLAMSKPRSLVDNARLFALVNMAATDAFVAVFDGKYKHNFWRPVTAIRNGDIDGNDATAPDPAWLPFVDTPMHPEYPCAHCISTASVGAVLEAEFGTGKLPTFSVTSPTAPGVTRRFERIADYIKEVDNARIWGGIHYRNSTEVGERMGREIGKLTYSSVLVPAQ